MCFIFIRVFFPTNEVFVENVKYSVFDVLKKVSVLFLFYGKGDNHAFVPILVALRESETSSAINPYGNYLFLTYLGAKPTEHLDKWQQLWPPGRPRQTRSARRAQTSLTSSVNACKTEQVEIRRPPRRLPSKPGAKINKDTTHRPRERLGLTKWSSYYIFSQHSRRRCAAGEREGPDAGRMHNGGHFLLQHTRLRNSQVIIAARNNLILGIPPRPPIRCRFGCVEWLCEGSGALQFNSFEEGCIMRGAISVFTWKKYEIWHDGYRSVKIVWIKIQYVH